MTRMDTATATYQPEGVEARAAIDNFAETVVRQAGVPSARARITSAQDQLDKAVSVLLERIAPVLTDDRPMIEKPDDPMHGAPEYSDHANWLHSQAASVEETTARLHRIIDRIDL